MSSKLIHKFFSRLRRGSVVRAMLFVGLTAFLLPAIGGVSVPASAQEVRPDLSPEAASRLPRRPVPSDSTVFAEGVIAVDTPYGIVAEGDTLKTVVEDPDNPYVVRGRKEFNPDPARAVWMSALLPGLGQIYNRRYWKLPIVVGGFMGLAYGTNWNNTQYTDYTRAYRDLLDSDPDTKSYMNFFPPTTGEEDLDKSWLTNVLKTRKDYYRRNRDLCIIGMVGLYLLAIVDAYVDASLAHFDISPDVAMDVAPAVITPSAARSGSAPASILRGGKPSVGLQWALTF